MRINRILHAMKVRGFYDGSLQGLKDLLNSDDNTLLPIKNAAAMREGQTVENSIWLVPIEPLVKLLQQLIPAREAVKNTIYEITGISDIMRGDTRASETATAQNIKNTYGTLRLNQFRKKVQVYARDCLRIMAEIAAKHFSLETFAKVTNCDFAMPQEVKEAQEAQQRLEAQMMQMQQQAMMQQQLQAPPGSASAQPAAPAGAPPTLTPGAPAAGAPQAPPQPPQPSPEMQQQMQQIQAILQKPQWEQVVGLLRDNLQRYYRIDIETNSTIASDTAEDKQNIVEALQAISQVFSELGPLAQQGVLPVPAVKTILMAVVRRFQFGRAVEDALAQIPDQLPQGQGQQEKKESGPSPEELQAKQQIAQTDLQIAQIGLQKAQRTDEMDQQQHQYNLARMAREEEMAVANHKLKIQQTQLKLQQAGIEDQAAKAKAVAEITKANVGAHIARQKAMQPPPVRPGNGQPAGI
jgi:hypothetical protein